MIDVDAIPYTNVAIFGELVFPRFYDATKMNEILERTFEMQLSHHHHLYQMKLIGSALGTQKSKFSGQKDGFYLTLHAPEREVEIADVAAFLTELIDSGLLLQAGLILTKDEWSTSLIFDVPASNVTSG